jgi:TolA-binding protein
MTGEHPSEEELSRALGPGGDARIARHAEGCEPCRSVQASFRRAIEQTRGLPHALPAPARRDEVRAALLARGAAEPLRASGRRGWLVGLAALATAVLVAAAVKRGREPAPARSRVVVRSGVGARWELSPPPWETVRLWEGTVELEVEPLGPGERVRVQVGDGEVEVRGTRFQVEAHGDRLVGVEVTHGRVEVRPATGAMTVLGAGQTWRAPAAVAEPAVAERTPAAVAEPAVAERTPGAVAAPAPPAVAEAAPAKETVPALPPPEVPAPTARELAARLAGTSRRAAKARRLAARAEAGVERALRPTRQEELYDDAWDALRARRFEEAARGFDRVLAASTGGPLADEAAFWRATSLARGGRSDEAVAAFRKFVTAYRASPRRGEASTILGWLLVDRRQPDDAAPLFRGAVNDPDPNVRKSARDGLAAISPR